MKYIFVTGGVVSSLGKGLTATALGLGAFQTAGLRDAELERALGVDGIEEIVLYALGAGVTAAPALGPSFGMAPART